MAEGAGLHKYSYLSLFFIGIELLRLWHCEDFGSLHCCDIGCSSLLNYGSPCYIGWSKGADSQVHTKGCASWFARAASRCCGLVLRDRARQQHGLTHHQRQSTDPAELSTYAIPFRGQGFQRCRQDDVAFSSAAFKSASLCLHQNLAEAQGRSAGTWYCSFQFC